MINHLKKKKKRKRKRKKEKELLKNKKPNKIIIIEKIKVLNPFLTNLFSEYII